MSNLRIIWNCALSWVDCILIRVIMKKAISEHEKVIELDPKNVVAYLYLSIIYAAENNFIQAEEYFKKMLKIDPDNLTGIYYYAKLFGRYGKVSGSRGDVQKSDGVAIPL